MQPRDANWIAFLQVGYARADRRDNAGTLVAGNKWWGGLDRPITVGGMEIRMANPGRDDLHQYLPRTRGWYGDLLDSK